MIGSLLVLALFGAVLLSLWAVVDASLQPDVAYRDAGLSKGWVTGLLIMTCVVGALVYFPVIKPRLRPHAP